MVLIEFIFNKFLLDLQFLFLKLCQLLLILQFLQIDHRVFLLRVLVLEVVELIVDLFEEARPVIPVELVDRVQVALLELLLKHFASRLDADFVTERLHVLGDLLHALGELCAVADQHFNELVLVVREVRIDDVPPS